MLAIIDFEGDKDSDKNYRYGTYRFEYIWEKMIDKVFGIENKADYFPKTTWYVNGSKYDNASLEPDTVMLYGTDVYVLDAKYYKYGVTGKTLLIVILQYLLGAFAHKKTRIRMFSL